jgi:predicted dehydrogenase/threonine dehydrogenase-like Zn-dependent dehydrogenase
LGISLKFKRNGHKSLSAGPMKQVLQEIQSGETKVVDVPVPKPGKGMALVQTRASLVSVGTERSVVAFAGRSLAGKARQRPDLVRQVLEKARREGLLSTAEAVRSRLDQPLALGYASAGTVLELGEGLQGVKVGDRVACAGGGYAVHAEYAVVPQNLLAHLPESVSFEEGTFATLGAIAMHGFRLAEPQVGEHVAVIGLGVLGLLAASVSLAAGCRVFGVDVDPMRVEAARAVGAEAALRKNAEEVGAAVSGGHGFDILLICAASESSDPVELAGVLARDRARVIALGDVGLDVPRRTYFQKELTLRVSRSYGPGRYDTVYEEKGLDYPIGYVRWTEGRNLQTVVDLLAAGKLNVKPLISHRFPVEDAVAAYDLIKGESGEPFLGVLLTYPFRADSAESLQRKMVFEEGGIPAAGGVRLGAFGAGNFASNVLYPILRRVRGVELVGLAAASGMSANRVGRRFGFRYAVTDESKLLEDSAINTIAVLTRHHLHAQQVLASLEAGKHVFCEKPLALTREELARIYDALLAGESLLCVGFNRRFTPLARRMKAFLDDGKGPLVMHYRVNAGALPRDHWLHDPEQGGGRIIGEVCHFIDFLTYLLGSPPVRVSTQSLPDDERYREDNVLLQLKFGDGSLGTIAYLANGDRAYSKERVEAFGRARVAVLDDFRALELASGGRKRIERAWLRQDKGHKGIWEAFEAAVRSGGPAPIPYNDLAGVTLASFAAMDSLRSGDPVLVEPLHIE